MPSKRLSTSNASEVFVVTPNHDGALARAGFYGLIGIAFDYPFPELHEAARSGRFYTALSGFEDRLSLPRTNLPVVDYGFEGLESAYISMFEIGARGQPAHSLHEGDYRNAGETNKSPGDGQSRNETFESLLRFYEHFGLRLTTDASERVQPDHICCELEMLAFLAFQESQATDAPEAVASWRLAQRDFIDRHIGAWLPSFVEKLDAVDICNDGAHFYRNAANALLTGLKHHRAVLDCGAGRITIGEPD